MWTLPKSKWFITATVLCRSNPFATPWIPAGVFIPPGYIHIQNNQFRVLEGVTFPCCPTNNVSSYPVWISIRMRQPRTECANHPNAPSKHLGWGAALFFLFYLDSYRTIWGHSKIIVCFRFPGVIYFSHPLGRVFIFFPQNFVCVPSSLRNLIQNSN